MGAAYIPILNLLIVLVLEESGEDAEFFVFKICDRGVLVDYRLELRFLALVAPAENNSDLHLIRHP